MRCTLVDWPTAYKNLQSVGVILLLLGGVPTRATAEPSEFVIGVVETGTAQSGAASVSLSGAAARRMAWEVRKRTSVDASMDPVSVRLDDPRLFEMPFLVWAGIANVDPLSPAELRGLQRFLLFGGFLFVDDGDPDSLQFSKSVKAELARALPGRQLVPLKEGHTVYRSFYLADRAEGRVAAHALLLGLELDGRIAVVVSQNDIAGALDRDELGAWKRDVVPGGEAQRDRVMRLFVNVVMYSLCLDYKDDQVHAPFIMRRRGARR